MKIYLKIYMWTVCRKKISLCILVILCSEFNCLQSCTVCLTHYAFALQMTYFLLQLFVHNPLFCFPEHILYPLSHPPLPLFSLVIFLMPLSCDSLCSPVTQSLVNSLLWSFVYQYFIFGIFFFSVLVFCLHHPFIILSFWFFCTSICFTISISSFALRFCLSHWFLSLCKILSHHSSRIQSLSKASCVIWFSASSRCFPV